MSILKKNLDRSIEKQMVICQKLSTFEPHSTDLTKFKEQTILTVYIIWSKIEDDIYETL